MVLSQNCRKSFGLGLRSLSSGTGSAYYHSAAAGVNGALQPNCQGLARLGSAVAWLGCSVGLCTFPGPSGPPFLSVTSGWQ